MISCRRESTTWNTEVDVPLFRGALGLEQIIPDSLLSADQNGLWHLIYSDDLTDLNIDSLVNITDTTFSQSFTVPFSSGTITLPAGASIINVQQDIELNGGGAQLRLIRMKGGTMTYTIRSYINGYMTSVFTMPGVTGNGVPVSITANTAPSLNDIPSEYSGTIDVTGYEIALTGINGSQVNSIASSIAVSVASDAPSSALVQGQDSVVVELSFENAIVEYALGYFGQHQYNLNETVSFLQGTTMPQGLLALERASMKMRLENFIGVDARIFFDEINALGADNSVLSLTYAPFNQNINVTRALDLGGTIWPTFTNFDINETNSNITSWVGQLPQALQINGTVDINPLGNISGSSDFIYTEFPLKATIDVDIPLRVNSSQITLRDTIEIQEKIQEDFFGHLVMLVENGFPLNATLHLKLRDVVTGSEYVIASNELIQAGIPGDTDGEITPVTSTIRINADTEVFKRIKENNVLILEATMSTPTVTDYYGIYSHYRMNYKAMLEGTYGVNVN